jgi:hypothetical protein
MVTFNTLALWAAVRLAVSGRPRHLFVGAAAMALGIAAQYHAAVVALPLALAWLWRMLDAPGERGRWLMRGIGAAALTIGLFLLLSPYTMLDFATFRRDLEWISSTTAAEHLGYTTSLLSGLAHYLRHCLLPTLRIPIALLALAGAPIAVARRDRTGILLTVFSLAYTLVASRAGQLTDRYALPLVPPMALLAAMALQAGAARAFGSRPIAARVVMIAALVCSVPSLLALIENDFLMTRPDTLILAKRWFEERVPENERVALDMARFWNSTSPPLAENAARLRERIVEVQGGDMGGGHNLSYADFYRDRLEHPRHPAYYVLGTNMGAEALPLAEYRARGFRWAISSDIAEETQQAIAVHGDSTGVRYYAALEREATLAAEFGPKRWARLGPRIRIWRLDRTP